VFEDWNQTIKQNGEKLFVQRKVETVALPWAHLKVFIISLVENGDQKSRNCVGCAQR